MLHNCEEEQQAKNAIKRYLSYYVSEKATENKIAMNFSLK